MRATVNIQPLVSTIALIALAGALLAAAVALNDAQAPPAQSTNTQPSVTATGAFDAELARCNSIGPELANDAVYKAVWEANRKRFFESRKSSSPAEVSKTTPQSPATPSASPAPFFGDGPGVREQ
jgi:conjugative transfer region protein TrbK